MSRWIFLLLIAPASYGQLAPLTVEKIMRDPKWIGVAPTDPHWIGNTLYFNWNPEHAAGDSLYAVTLTDLVPRKVSPASRRTLPATEGIFNIAHTKLLFEKNGDLFIADQLSGVLTQITNTIQIESNARFSSDEKKVFFTAASNLYSWNIQSGIFSQLTNFREGDREPEKEPTPQDKWLRADQLTYFDVLKRRKQDKKASEDNSKANKPKGAKEIFLAGKAIENIAVSADESFISYKLSKNQGAETKVPSYVTESGFTIDLPARAKVGSTRSSDELFVYDLSRDTVIEVKTDGLPGITDQPDYMKDYQRKAIPKGNDAEKRPVDFESPINAPDGKHALIAVRSQDHKDRWIALLDYRNHALVPVYRQHDEAWIGWINSLSSIGWVDDQTIWLVSEETGFAHIYLIDITNGTKRALTSGAYEVQEVRLSNDKRNFYIITNEVHPGEKQLYRLSISGGKAVRLTTMIGAHEFVLSGDEKWIAYRYSYSNKPWELYLQENKVGSKPRQVTFSTTDEFRSYAWREPEIVTFKARDGASVYTRLYRPSSPNGAAVIFVHGAGYLQNAHKWWSYYFREYMFHNLLADKGYTVIDMDYRASAGYGREWRTSIYRHMGGKDLSDNVDGAKWLVDNYKIDPKRIGIYGGSYGGFITLMALFTTPDVFAAGAALRPVTDWAHYSDPYTSSILNEPFTDSLAYARSSPIYYADGLKNSLLICHGMVDVNVHFQDAVMLAQRLIELGKDNWELAVYPMEDHAFVEPSSWTDEYKRILKLFEEKLH